MLSILLGPSVAQTGVGSGAVGYADKFNMRSITIPTIAFAAAIVSSPASTRLRRDIFEQARHALTTDGKFTWASSGAGFSYLTFYHTVIKTRVP
jgi:hypothetical protein